MIKNKELIFKMSLEQRIRLITSETFGESRTVENYQFPVVKFSSDPAATTEGQFATIFPSDKALACTWNFPLVRNVYRCIGNEAKANAPYGCFHLSDNRTFENVSEDYFYTGRFLAMKAQGVNESGAFLGFMNAPGSESELLRREAVKLVTDSVMTESKPDALCVPNVAAAEEFPARYAYGGLIFGVAFKKEEVAQYLFRGCTLVFLQGDFADELEGYLTGLIEEHRRVKAEYDGGRMPYSEYDRRMRSGEILDEEAVNAACDRMVSLLLDLRGRNAASVSETPAAIDKSSHEPLFNEVYHDKLALRAAQQSIVLLKNEGGVLPFRPQTKLAVLGEYAANPAYQPTGNIATGRKLPFDLINDCELDCVGFANGYQAGQKGRGDLLETACKLACGAEAALVYLCAEAGATALPAGQLELIERLAERGVKIVAVVAADGVIDTAFTEKCAAVLYTCRSGQGVTQAALDILTGAVSPSGKLTESFPLSLNGFGDSGVRYPFGYGLSYTNFSYRNLKITERGVSCTVENTGGCDGFVTVQLYVRKEGSGTTLGYSLLRGFSKQFVKKNDAVRVEIPFDGNTFRTYDPDKKRYRIEGGNYDIFVGDDVNTVRLKGELTLAGHVYRDDVFTNEPLPQTDPVGFTDTLLEKRIRKEKKKLSFGVKLFLAIVLALYYDAVGAVLMFTNIVAEKEMLFYIVTGVLLLLGNAVAAIYITVIAKRRKYQRYLHPNDVLTDLVDKAEYFDEIARVSYEKPVSVTEEEFSAGEEVQTEETLPAETEEARIKKYEEAFAFEPEEIEFSEKVSFGELCANFRTYAQERGVSVEISSVRALFGAMASGKILFLTCRNREVRESLLQILCDYFGVPGVTQASDDWRSPDDLLWQPGGSDTEYVPSDFAHAVNGASKSPEKNCTLILDNVNLSNLRGYFIDFIEYALSPSEEHTLVISEDLVLRMPDNLCYLLFPASDDFAEELTPELAHAGMLVDLVAGPSESDSEDGERTEAKTLSRAAVAELVREAREEFYLSEKIWKKLDDLAEAIGAAERFGIDNKSLLQIEKFTSVLLESGSDETEAFVNAFTAKVVPLLKTLRIYRSENGGKTVYGYIEKLFGEENITAIRRALVKAE